MSDKKGHSHPETKMVQGVKKRFRDPSRVCFGSNDMTVVAPRQHPEFGSIVVKKNLAASLRADTVVWSWMVRQILIWSALPRHPHVLELLALWFGDDMNLELPLRDLLWYRKVPALVSACASFDLGTWCTQQMEHRPFDPLVHLPLVLFQCCSALHAVHETGIVHRDIKPWNFVCFEHQSRDLALTPLIQLIDYEHAMISSDFGGPSISQTVGTYIYQSPEVLSSFVHAVLYDKTHAKPRPVQAPGTAADMWSLGMMMLRLLLGEIFQDGTVTTPSKALAIIYSWIEFPPLKEKNKEEDEEEDKKSQSKSKKKKKKIIQYYTPLSPEIQERLRLVLAKLPMAERDATMDFLQKLLCLDPVGRMSAGGALRHPYFSIHYKGQVERFQKLPASEFGLVRLSPYHHQVPRKRSHSHPLLLDGDGDGGSRSSRSPEARQQFMHLILTTRIIRHSSTVSALSFVHTLGMYMHLFDRLPASLPVEALVQILPELVACLTGENSAPRVRPLFLDAPFSVMTQSILHEIHLQKMNFITGSITNKLWQRYMALKPPQTQRDDLFLFLCLTCISDFTLCAKGYSVEQLTKACLPWLHPSRTDQKQDGVQLDLLAALKTTARVFHSNPVPRWQSWAKPLHDFFVKTCDWVQKNFQADDPLCQALAKPQEEKHAEEQES